VDGQVALDDDKGRLVDTVEAAKLLLLSPRTLEGMRFNAQGPRYIKLGTGARAKVVYRISDLDAWLDQNTRKPGDDSL
jgi:hypothetical protein